jgi:hypothetical protein
MSARASSCQRCKPKRSVFQRWIDYYAWLIALFLIPASVVREWHENAGKGRNLFWWIGRLAVCLLLFAPSIALIDELIVAGKEIAEGNEGVSESLLLEFYATQHQSFNESYDKLVDITEPWSRWHQSRHWHPDRHGQSSLSHRN